MLRFIAVVLIGVIAWAGNAMAGPNGSVVIVEGFSAPNSYSGEMPDIFYEWCGKVCFPTVTLEAVDVQKTRHLGYVHAWGKEFEAEGDTIKFKQFVLYAFRG